MKSKIFKGYCLAAVLVAAFAGTLMAQDEAGFSATASVDYFNKYIWRGQNLNDESVLQFNASGSAWGFTGAIWSNIPLTDAQGTTIGEFNEIDYSLDFSRVLPNSNDRVGYSLGVNHYTFPGSIDNNGSLSVTTEIYGGLNFNVPLSPSITWNRDVDAIDGSYIEFKVGHTFEKIGSWSDASHANLELSVSLGLGGSAYNAGYFGCDTTKFNDLTLSVGVPFNLKYGMSIKPSFNVSTMLDGDIRNAIETGGAYAGKHTNTWFGINFTKNF